MQAVQRWDDVLPQYAVGHRERVAAVEAELAREAPGLRIAGSYTGGASVDDVLARGQAIARELLERLPVPEEAPA